MELDYLLLDPALRGDRDRLFTLIGPLFASRRVRREMPYMHHEEGYVWSVAVTPLGEAAAMGSVDVRQGVATLRNLYVAPAWRGCGVGRHLTDLLFGHACGHGARWMRAVASPRAVGVFERRGFYRVSARGQYVTMELAL
ncbi:acetyltransferase (GNAT) family protein [mine drainage metagenome]|uniref:Acetyltransferase (GNAT) family protein n=1 Tax=mine drainage metagenome TaxID=410659 RepID=A0A1J5SL42_9ZZZZ